MTSSAVDRAADGGTLGRTRDLYRDLTVALRDRITHLTAGSGEEADVRDAVEVVRDHRRVLEAVLEIEATLGTARGTDTVGSTLDLDAARAEVLARLAVWAAAG
jgi:hypothetical protein